jgi:tetratricopeptide (TPR) repeat protein
MQSTSTTAHASANATAQSRDGRVVHRIFSNGAARRVLLVAVVSSIAGLVPASFEAPAQAAPKVTRKSAPKSARASAKKRTVRRKSSYKGSRYAKKAPSRSLHVAVGGALTRHAIKPADTPSLLQVKTQVSAAGPATLLAQATETAPTAPSTPSATATSTAAPEALVPVAPQPVVPQPAAPTPDGPQPATPLPAAPVLPDVVIPVAPGAPVDATGAIPSVTTPANSPVADLSPPGTVAEQAIALRGLGEIRRRQRRFNEAEDFFRRATLLDPSDVPSRVGLAQSLRGQEKFREALVEAEQALTLAPNNLQARVIHAQLLSDNDRPAEAAKELEALVASLPEKPLPDTYTALAQAFVSLRNYDAALAILARGKADYPQDEFIARNTAETLTYAKRWEDAIAAWDALIAADAKDADAVLGKARVYNYSSREEQAEPLYRRALEIEPENYQAQVELADIVGRRGNWPEAVTLYRSALAKNAGDLTTRVELARVLRYLGRYNEAETELNAVLAADARFAPAYTERGILRGQNKRYELAIADLQQALKLTPTDVYAQFGLAEILGYNKQYDESIRLYRAALEKEPDNQKGRVELGLVLAYANRFDEALKEFNAVLADNPNNVNAKIGKADTLARSRRFDESIALYNQILTADPNNRRANTGLAEALVYNKQYTQAIAIYDRLLAERPDDVSLAIDRGRALGYAGMHREAVKALRPLVASNPDNQDARLSLAEALTNSGDRAMREEAIGHYRTLLQADAGNLDARYGLGRALSYQGRIREAEAELNQVIKARPNDADAYYALAEAQRYNKPFDAKENYQRAVKLGPNSVNAARASVALRELRRDTRPSLELSARRYTDSNNVRLTEYGGGPTFRTRQGNFGIYARTGRYQDEGIWQTRRVYSLMASRKFGSISARLMLHRVNYFVAPDRTLYDLLFEKRSSERKRYYINFARNEIIESLGATNAGITAKNVRAGVEWPLGRHFDAELAGRYYRYSDGNTRYTLSPALYYRLRPTSPTLRVGLGYTRDNTRFLAPAGAFYYTPQDYSTFAILADYVKTQGRTRYGLFAAHPLSDNTGIGGINRPADTLFGFFNYDLSDALQLFVEGGVVRGPTFDSNEIHGGLNIWF